MIRDTIYLVPIHAKFTNNGRRAGHHCPDCVSSIDKVPVPLTKRS